MAALGVLSVKEALPVAGYDRGQFGPLWADANGNGCDTRNDILRRDLTALQIKAGTQGCVALSGTLTDAYSAQVIAFVRGAGTSEAVQVDHVVSVAATEVGS